MPNQVARQLFCPTCGTAVEVARYLGLQQMYEMACERCDTTHVVMLHDHQKLPDLPTFERSPHDA